MNIEKALELDSSKIADYMNCPRYFFYRHVAGWSGERANLDLVFGEAWHRAKAYVLQARDSEPDQLIVDNAMSLFEEYYRKYFTDDTDLTNFPKNPGNAEAALRKYLDIYEGDGRLEVLQINGKPAIEIFGLVPISVKRLVRFRMDAICKDSRGILFVDHKTSKMNSPAYQSQFRLSNQMLTYTHATHCIYPQTDIFGGLVDMTIFKKENEHLRIPIRKSPDMMNEWLWNINKWYDHIEQDAEELQYAIEKSEPMQCFCKNDKGCTAYNRLCSFYDFCIAWSNPLEHIHQPPEGMVERYWSPFDYANDSSIILKL